MSNFDIDSEIRLVVSGEKTLQQLSKALVDAGEDAEMIDHVLAETSKQMIATGRATDSYRKTVQKLGAELNKLSKFDARSALSQLDPVTRGDARAAAGDDRSETAAKMASQTSWEAYKKASDRRIAQAERNELRQAKTEFQAYTAQRIAGAKAVQQAERATARAQQESAEQLINMRYAQYDAAAAYTSIGIAAGAATAATIGMGASMERDFASVARTTGATGESLNNLESDLIDLSNTMPIVFKDITNVATIGAQLNVMEKDLADFTKVVTMFSSTTDASVDDTAMSMGRLSQLTSTAGEEMENLASAVYETGVTSVATESAILAMSSELATSGDLAGLTNHEIVGLSATLASLGLAPEGARGAIMKFFGDLDKATTEGGPKLAKFASVAGMSAGEFSEAWQNRPQEAISAFINGLGRIEDGGGAIKDTLRDLEITEIRYNKLLSVLGNNSELYADSLRTSAEAYKDGTALAEGYAIQTDNLLDKLIVLKNTLSTGFGSGSGGFIDDLKQMTDWAIRVTKAMSEFAQTPVGGRIVSITAAIAGGIAVWAAYRTAVALLRGNLAALATANQTLNASTMKTNQSLIGLAVTFARVAAGSEKAIAGVLGTSAALDKASASANGAAVATTRTQAAMSKVGGLAVGVAKFAGPMAAFAGAIHLGTMAWEAYSESIKTAEQKAEDFFGNFDGLAAAIADDTEAVGKGAGYIREVVVEYDNAGEAASNFSTGSGTVVSAQEAVAGATNTTSDALTTQTKYLGENTAEWIHNAVTTNEEFAALWGENSELLTSAGFDLETYFAKMLEGGDKGKVYVEGFLQTAKVNAKEASDAWDGYSDAQRRGTEIAGGDAEAALKRVGTTESLVTSLEKLVGIQENVNTAVDTSTNLSQINAAATKVFKTELDEANKSAEDMSDTLSDLVRDLSGETFNTAGVEDALNNLGQSLANNGAVFDVFSENGRANMDALRATINAMAVEAGDDSVAFANSVGGLLAAVQAQGAGAAGELDWVLQLLNATMGNQWGVDFSTEAARSNIRKFIADLIAQQEALAASIKMQNQYAAMTQVSPFNIQDTKVLAPQMDTSAIDGLRAMLNSMNASAGDTARATAGIGNGMAQVKREAGGAAKNTDKLGKAADKANKKIRTMSEYASDVAGVFARSMELRFGINNAKRDVSEAIADARNQIEKAEWPSIAELLSDKNNRKLFARQEARDSIVMLFRDLKDAAREAKDAVNDAAQAIKDANAQMQDLKAREAALLYWREVSLAYGNTARVMQIDAELAQVRAEQAKVSREAADAQRDLAAAQEAANNKSLTGNSTAAINNREDVRGLVNEHLAYIQALKDSGATQSTIDAAVKQSTKDFMAQGKALGFSESELKGYASAIEDSSKVTQGAALTQGEILEILQGVVGEYGEVAEAMLSAGYSQDEVNAYLAQARTKVKELAAELGASPSTIAKATNAIDDFVTIVKNVPKDVNVKINVRTPAESAIKEFLAKYDNNTVNIKAQGTGSVKSPVGGWPAVSVPVNGIKSISVDKVTTTDKVISVSKALASVIAAKRGANGKTGTIAVSKATATAVDTIAKSMGIPKAKAAELLADLITVATSIDTPKVNATTVKANNLTGALGPGPVKNRWGGIADGSIKAFARGGSVMNSRSVSRGRDTVHALLDPKEFVMNREAHSWYGTDFMQALNERKIPKEFHIPVVQHSAPQNGIQLVEVLPTQINQIVNAVVASIQPPLNMGDVYGASQQISSLQVGQGRG